MLVNTFPSGLIIRWCRVRLTGGAPQNTVKNQMLRFGFDCSKTVPFCVTIHDVRSDVRRFLKFVSIHWDKLGPYHAVASVELWQLNGSEPPF